MNKRSDEETVHVISTPSAGNTERPHGQRG